jgi:signal transduction histidine kinase
MHFDIPTATLIVGLMYFLFPLTVYVFLKSSRTTPVLLWCLGGALNGFGFMAIALRIHFTEISQLITFTLPNILLFLGILLRIQSLKIECDTALKNNTLITLTILFAAMYEIVRFKFGSDIGRMAFLIPTFTVVTGWLAYASWEYEKVHKIKLIRAITYNYLAYSLILAIKSLLMLTGYDNGKIMASNLINTSMSLIAVIAVVYTNLGYIGVVLERVNNERKATIQLNAKLNKSLKKREDTIKSFVRLKAFSALGGQGTAVVHEIMQPLTAMRFGLENLTRYFEKQGAPTEVFERINAAKDPAERSIKIVQNLRNLMVENNIEIKAVDLHEKISDCLIVLRDRISSLQINVNINSLNKEFLVLADNNQIQHVLLNILSNAIDAIELHTLSNKERKVIIQIAYVDKKRYVTLDIIDTGLGIPEKIRNNLFEWLSTGTKKGMGVGLALCKHFVESWGGSISADNVDEHKTGFSGAIIHLKLRAA